MFNLVKTLVWAECVYTAYVELTYLQPLIKSFQQTKTEELLKPTGHLLIYEPRVVKVFDLLSIHNGCIYCQDAAAYSQQPGVPACSQCGCQEGFPHGGHGLLLHHVLHCGERHTHTHCTDGYSCCKEFYCLALYSCSRLKHPLVKCVTPGCIGGWEDFTSG